MLKVWGDVSRREPLSMKLNIGGAGCVALSGDGRLAVSASADNTLKIWEVESRRELRTLRGHTGWVRGVALSLDGRVTVSSSEDWTLKVWEVGSGSLLTTFTCDAPALCCTLDGDYKLIVAGDAGGHVHFLRLEEPKAKG